MFAENILTNVELEYVKKWKSLRFIIMERKIASGILKFECKHCLEVNVVLNSAHLHFPVTKF